MTAPAIRGASPCQQRVDAADWAAITAGLDDLGCALTPRLITAADASELIGLYDRDEAFRSLPHLQGLVFTTRDRPLRTQRGWSAAPVRHGVSVLRSGERYTLGILFHDAP